MSDFFVPAMSAVEIRLMATNLRYVLGFGDSYVPNICGILEHDLRNVVPGYQFSVQEQIILEDGAFAAAETQMDPPTVTMAADEYRRLVENNPRARFTGAHELGHLLLHYGSKNLNRMTNVARSQFKSNSAEWQANTFAGGFLAPEHLLRHFQTPEEAASMLCISVEVARIQMKTLELIPIKRDISAWQKIRSEMGLR
jgi:hypothetical protein